MSEEQGQCYTRGCENRASLKNLFCMDCRDKCLCPPAMVNLDCPIHNPPRKNIEQEDLSEWLRMYRLSRRAYRKNIADDAKMLECIVALATITQLQQQQEHWESEKARYQEFMTRNLEGKCICPARTNPKSDTHWPGCPVKLQQDKAELAAALKDVLIESGWCDSYYDSLVAKHSQEVKK